MELTKSQISELFSTFSLQEKYPILKGYLLRFNNEKA